MAINMELTLLFHIMIILMTADCIIPQENISAENINEILEKLIHQTQQINETDPNADLQDLTTVVETQTDNNNDSNIYYIKTVMQPHIDFKSSSEILHGTHNSNKTDQSREVINVAHSLTSEHEPFSGATKISTKILSHKQSMPKLIHGGQESVYTEFKARTGYVDESDYSSEDLIKKELGSELSTTNDKKQISFTQSGHQNEQLNILHQYPEIIIDHVTYDNHENDKNKVDPIKFTPDDQHVLDVVKEEETKGKFPTVLPRNIGYNIPEDENEIADQELPEIETRNYLAPDMKGIIDAIIQKKMMQDVLLKQTTENESRKQSMLLEKILQRLPDKRRITNNVKSSYTLRHERIAPVEVKTLSHLLSTSEALHRNGVNHLTKSYLNVPIGHSKWEMHNRLLKTLMRMYRPEILKRTRVVAGLIDRIVPNIDYRPVYYDLYTK